MMPHPVVDVRLVDGEVLDFRCEGGTTMVAVVEHAAQQDVHKRRVNDLIHESLRDHLESEPIAFFCECARPRCFETVWLTPMEYEKNRSNPRWRARSARH